MAQLVNSINLNCFAYSLGHTLAETELRHMNIAKYAKSDFKTISTKLARAINCSAVHDGIHWVPLWRDSEHRLFIQHVQIAVLNETKQHNLTLMLKKATLNGIISIHFRNSHAKRYRSKNMSNHLYGVYVWDETNRNVFVVREW